jgi:Zn-dependent peptidase ImmA (M78 family)
MAINQTYLDVKDKLWHKGFTFATYQAQKLLQESGFTRPPFLPEHLAALMGIKILKEDLGNLNSLLIPLRNGFQIKINMKYPPNRQHFSCAHEIAHTFFFEREGKALIQELAEGNGNETSNDWEEALCDISASELLMPSQIFTKYASRYYFGVRGIRSLTPLSRIFNTSIIPIVLRLCDLTPNPCFVVHWTRDKSDKLDDLKLRAKWLTWSRKKMSSRAGRFFFNPKLFGEHSTLLKAYRSDSPTYSYQCMGVGNFRGNCKIWSQGFGSGSFRFVISLIFPECDN